MVIIVTNTEMINIVIYKINIILIEYLYQLSTLLFSLVYTEAKKSSLYCRKCFFLRNILFFYQSKVNYYH